MIETILVEDELIYQGPRAPMETAGYPPHFSFIFYREKDGSVWAHRLVEGGLYIYIPSNPPNLILGYEWNELSFPPEVAIYICDFLIQRYNREQSDREISNPCAEGSPDGRIGNGQDLLHSHPG